MTQPLPSASTLGSFQYPSTAGEVAPFDHRVPGLRLPLGAPGRAAHRENDGQPHPGQPVHAGSGDNQVAENLKRPLVLEEGIVSVDR